MSDGDVEIVEQPVEQAAEKPARAPRPERPPPPKVLPPDAVAHEKITKQLEAEIEAGKKKVADLTPKINENIEKRAQARAAFGELMKQMRALREVQKAAGAEMDTIKAKQAKAEGDIEAKKMRVDAARKDLKFKNPESIDEEVRKIEYTMTHTSLSLKEEKQYMAEIKELKQSKSVFKAYNDAKAELDGVDHNTVLGGLREQRRQKTKDFIAAKEEANKLSDSVTAARKAEDDLNEVVTGLLKAKKHHQELVSKKIEEVRALRTAFKEQEWAAKNYQEWADYQKRQQIREARKARDAARAAEAAAAEASGDAEEETAEPVNTDCWAEEKELCRQLTSYLNRLLPQVKEEVVEVERGLDMDRRTETEEDMGRSLAVKTGRKKGAEEEDAGLFLGAGTASKKKGPKPESKAPKAPKKTALTHTPNVFEQFDLVGLLPPLTIDSVQASIEEVAAKVEFFEANPDKEAKEEWTKKREKASKEASRKVAAKPKAGVAAPAAEAAAEEKAAEPAASE